MQVQDDLKQQTQAQTTEQLIPDEEYFSDDPDVIFRREYSKLKTIPLQQHEPLCWPLVWLTIIAFLSFVGGAILGIVTYPTVTITLVPLSKQQTLTTHLDLHTHQLAPVTLTKSATASTTGKGHQDARAATGTLIIYNSLFTVQTVYAGTVFLSSEGVQVATSETITIPANSPPFDGKALVRAYALQPAAKGNIPAGAMHLVSHGLLIENTAFTGGRDARDYHAVSQKDLDTLTSTVQSELATQMPQAFKIQPGETLLPTNCHYQTTANHSVGDEAATLTVNVTYTCSALAYTKAELAQKAGAAFLHTRPGARYQVFGMLTSAVLTVSPFTVQITETWVRLLSQDDEQFLAEKIAGDTPAEARNYLLATGFLKDASVPTQLPRDPGHIHFDILISL